MSEHKPRWGGGWGGLWKVSGSCSNAVFTGSCSPRPSRICPGRFSITLHLCWPVGPEQAQPAPDPFCTWLPWTANGFLDILTLSRTQDHHGASELTTVSFKNEAGKLGRELGQSWHYLHQRRKSRFLHSADPTHSFQSSFPLSLPTPMSCWFPPIWPYRWADSPQSL